MENLISDLLFFGKNPRSLTPRVYPSNDEDPSGFRRSKKIGERPRPVLTPGRVNTSVPLVIFR
jgi:hypothetical protein